MAIVARARSSRRLSGAKMGKARKLPSLVPSVTWSLLLRNSSSKTPSKSAVVLRRRMSKTVSIALAGLLALFSAAASPAAAQNSTKPAAKPHPGAIAARSSGPATQSGTYTVSQLGHTVGTAEFHFTPTSAGFDSTSTVHVSMQGLEYALSKTEQLDATDHLAHVVLSATVNGQAVNISGKPDASNFLLNTSANGHTTPTRLAVHPAAVFLPDFDPGALETLLTLAATQNNRDLWVIIPKQAGSVEPVQLATYADEQGTLGGQPVTVHHLVASIAGANTDLFAGPDNQLLQAELPQQGFSLVRKGFVLTPPKRPGAAPPSQ